MITDYRIAHRPGDPLTYPEEVATVDKILSGDYFPKDILDHAKAYFTDFVDDPETKTMLALLKAAQNHPEMLLTIYRGAPSGGVLNTGDWVSLSESYAAKYAFGGAYADDENSRVYSYEVKAKDLSFDGDSLYEFGYWGEPLREQEEDLTRGKEEEGELSRY